MIKINQMPSLKSLALAMARTGMPAQYVFRPSGEPLGLDQFCHHIQYDIL